jgi:hypothetical protein
VPEIVVVVHFHGFTVIATDDHERDFNNNACDDDNSQALKLVN